MGKLILGMLITGAAGFFIAFGPVITNIMAAVIVYSIVATIGFFGMVLCEDYIAKENTDV